MTRKCDQSSARNSYLYTGREWDEDVDLQYNRARWYDPAVGRWISEDPIGFAAGDTNVARYVGSEVTKAVDPSGYRSIGSPQFSFHYDFLLNGHPASYTADALALQTMRFDAGRFAPVVNGNAPEPSRGFGAHAYNFLYGFSDVATLGLGPAIRTGIGYDPGIDRTDGWYWAGAAAPVVVASGGAATLPVMSGSATTIIGTPPGISGLAASGPGIWLLREGPQQLVDEAAGIPNFTVGMDDVGRAGRDAVEEVVEGAMHALPTRPPKTVYHQGDLTAGVSPNRYLSTSPDPDLRHYHPDGELYQFDIPADVYDEWMFDGTIQTLTDLHLPTGNIMPEVRIMPPGTGRMNDFLVAPPQGK